MFMELYDEKVVWLHKWGQFFIVPQFFGKMKVLTSGLINVIPSGKRIRMVWLWIFYKSWKAISFSTSWFSRGGEKQIPAMRGGASSDRNSFFFTTTAKPWVGELQLDWVTSREFTISSHSPEGICIVFWWVETLKIIIQKVAGIGYSVFNSFYFSQLTNRNRV